jgi:hypothetical protein
MPWMPTLKKKKKKGSWGRMRISDSRIIKKQERKKKKWKKSSRHRLAYVLLIKNRHVLTPTSLQFYANT